MESVRLENALCIVSVCCGIGSLSVAVETTRKEGCVWVVVVMCEDPAGLVCVCGSPRAWDLASSGYLLCGIPFAEELEGGRMLG